MEPGAGRLPLQVLGENEALQQFFSDQDVSGVLDSSVAVDTSILEQYLGNDLDPSNLYDSAPEAPPTSFSEFRSLNMLPESPPDSSSEACSPAQRPDFHPEAPHWSNQPSTQQAFHLSSQSTASSSCCFKDRGPAPGHHDQLTYDQRHSFGLTNTYIKSGPPPVPPAAPAHLHQLSHHSPEHIRYLSPEGCPQVYTPPTPPSPSLPSSHRYAAPRTGPGGVPHPTTPASTCGSGSAPKLHAHSPESKKRRRSECEETPSGIEPSSSDADGSCGASAGSGTGGFGFNLGLLTWEQYRPGQWSTLYSSSYQTLSPPAFHVDADKGFNYSAADEAFICQKKNHFQVTVHIGVAAEPQYVRTPNETREVDHFQIRLFGVKLESPSHQVTIEQSQPDRSKKPFHPVRVKLPDGEVTKVTLGRLHFAETTSNNMRKKGKPNPDQRFFQMVVGLFAAVGDDSFLLTALVSERIIVRASNPGQFEMDGDALWQRGGAVQDAVVCQGRVGINTDSPDEALVVCGNAKVMGTIMQPSDSRVKFNIQEVDSEQQLKRITQMRIVEFDYKPEFASTMGMDHTHQTGIIAQEVKQLLPDAVKEVGDVTCTDGEMIHNFLMVDKEQIFMENVGAVQQLSKLTDNLEVRINDLEVWNRRLAKLKSLTGSLRSTGKLSSVSSTSGAEPCKSVKVETERRGQKVVRCLQHRVVQAGVVSLIATVTFCIISFTVLYVLSMKQKDFDAFPGNSNGSTALQTTAWSSTVSPSGPPGHWPPDVDFCDLLYCDEVYCCPSPPEGSTGFNITESGGAGKPDVTRKRYHELEGVTDWRNTTIHSFLIKENQQLIDSKYCFRDDCGPGRFIYRVPISPFVPVNMRMTLIMNSTELLVVYLCSFDESAACSALQDKNTVTGSRYPTNSQGEHEWPLHVARLYHSSYHFRSTVAGQADCSTDHHFAGALFTDYIFHFFRHCTTHIERQIPHNVTL
ncbi:myelin regulatory factor-like protein isoform X1 [Platichthys flesus]|uniref:myelin regulatory factor-like protein isoform X1 n=1 Tax=Platichthys flesus TaxID=8260 RepID=UPI002DBE4B26|nr:myelin regulatory factor-like protein isoform X1 [Platichthys flesus]